jgi:hypothetical protein
MYADLAKSAVTLIASVGVGAVVTNAIKATTPDDLKIASKIAVVVGTFVASKAISDVASNYSEGKIDELTDGLKKLKAAFPSKKN